MRKVIRKYNQEFIAAMVIVGFWGAFWGYHTYMATQTMLHEEQESVQADDSQIEPPPHTSPAPTTDAQ